jgi:hypothetical protein
LPKSIWPAISKVARKPALAKAGVIDHYAHFMPEAGGKGRAAVDALLGMVPECIPEDLEKRLGQPRGAFSPDSPHRAGMVIP